MTFTYRKRTPEQWQARAEQSEAELAMYSPMLDEPLPLRKKKKPSDVGTPVPVLQANSSFINRITGALQENILTALCFDTEAIPTILAVIDSGMFESAVYRNIADQAIAYYQKYRKAAGDHLPDLLEQHITSGKRSETRLYSDALRELFFLKDGVNRQFVLDSLHKFARHQSLRQSITIAAEELQRGDTDRSIAELTRGLERARQGHSSGQTPGLLTDYELRKLEVPPIVDAIYPIVQFPGVTFISGAFGSAKTFFALKCAMAMASGRDFFNYTVGEPMSVLFMDFELPQAMLKQRRKIVRQTFPGKIDTSLLTYWSAAKCHAEGVPIPNFADPAQIPKLLTDYDKYDVVVIDNLSHAMRGVDMNIAESYDAPHDFTMKRKFDGKTTVIVQHLGKDASKGPRGSSRQEDWPDVSLQLTKSINSRHNAVIKLKCRKLRGHGESAFESIDIELRNDGGKFAMEHRTDGESKTDKIMDEYRQLLEGDLVKRGTQAELAKKHGVDKSLVSQIASKVTRAYRKSKE